MTQENLHTDAPYAEFSKNASANMEKSIRSNARFPEYVFNEKWEIFLFFDPDWVFVEEFPEKMKTLLEIEGGECACICNLDMEAGESGFGIKPNGTNSRYFFDKETTNDEYLKFLGGDGIVFGWDICIDSFACTSDKHDWCFYCERRDEIAVIAFRNASELENYRPVLSQLYATPIKQAIELPLTYPFSQLLPEWKRDLIKNYGKK